MKINKKSIYTNTLVNECKCTKKVSLKKCIWVKECEDMLSVFTDASRQMFSHRKIKKPKLTDKHKKRIFFFGVCSCGRTYYFKP